MEKGRDHGPPNLFIFLGLFPEFLTKGSPLSLEAQNAKFSSKFDQGRDHSQVFEVDKILEDFEQGRDPLSKT